MTAREQTRQPQAQAHSARRMRSLIAIATATAVIAAIGGSASYALGAQFGRGSGRSGLPAQPAQSHAR